MIKFRTRRFAVLCLLYPLVVVGDGVAGPRTPIIIAGGSITIYSLKDIDTWGSHKKDSKTFRGIRVHDHASFQFFPSMKGDSPQPSATGKLMRHWTIRVFTKENQDKTRFLEIEGQPGRTIDVRSSHGFSDSPHRALPDYDGRSFCESDSCNNPDDFHIAEEVRITGVRGGLRTPLKCADETCSIFIGKPMN